MSTEQTIPDPLPNPYYGHPFPLELSEGVTVRGISGNCYVVACPLEVGLESPTTATVANAPLEVPALVAALAP